MISSIIRSTEVCTYRVSQIKMRIIAIFLKIIILKLFLHSFMSYSISINHIVLIVYFESLPCKVLLSYTSSELFSSCFSLDICEDENFQFCASWILPLKSNILLSHSAIVYSMRSYIIIHKQDKRIAAADELIFAGVSSEKRASEGTD